MIKTLPTDSVWRIYGKKNPYYGVIGKDAFLNENINDQILDDFFYSGQEYTNNLFSTIRDKIDPDFIPEKILDFGCGPGRLVIPFSKYAKEVIGMDISQEMLDEAKNNCIKNNIVNVTLLLSDNKLSCIQNQKFDLVNAFIVLQHINTKRGEKILNFLVDSIKPNGIGVIHVTYCDEFRERKIINYFRYRIPYLNKIVRITKSVILGIPIINLPLMQMNNYNLNRIFYLLQKRRIKDVYTAFTDHSRYWGVILYFKKPL